MSDAVTSQDFPEIRWRGHWIWVPEEPVVPNFALVPTANPDAKKATGPSRKTPRLDSLPDRLPARITPDSGYVPFANGRGGFRARIGVHRGGPRYTLSDL